MVAIEDVTGFRDWCEDWRVTTTGQGALRIEECRYSTLDIAMFLDTSQKLRQKSGDA